jgi:ankyrin repeat protein
MLPFVPPEVFKEYMLPYYKHLKQIDNIQCRLEQGHNPIDLLRHAVIEGQESAVAYLINTKRNLPLEQALRLAANHGHLELVRYLCKLKDKNGNYRCNPSAYNNDEIRKAAMNGRLNVVKYLCGLTNTNGSYRIDPSADDNLVLRLAAENGHLNIVKFLCELTDSHGNKRCTPPAHTIKITIRHASRYSDVVNYLRGLNEKMHHINIHAVMIAN